MDSNPSNEYLWFVDKVEKLIGVDLTYYKPGQMERRIRHFIDRVEAKEFSIFYKRLVEDKALLRRFIDCITINVSEFFRDVERYKELESNILPYLIKRKKKLRIWSAGCSNGAEPYSIALILMRLTPLTKHYILASDVDTGILDRCREGRYLDREVRNIPPEVLSTYFTEIKDGPDRVVAPRYEIKQEVKDHVLFKQQNLLQETFEQDFDIIVCRNVVIYFTREAQQNLYTKFARSLNEGGILFVGSTESLLDCQKYGLKRMSTAFYCKGDEPADMSGKLRAGSMRA